MSKTVMYNTFASILHLLVWSQVNLSTVSWQRSFYPAAGLKTNLKLIQDALLTPPSPQSIYVGFLFPLLWKPIALSPVLLLLMSVAPFAFTLASKAVGRCSLRRLVFTAAHPPSGQREGDFHLQGHFLPWHTDCGIWWLTPAHRQVLPSSLKPVKLEHRDTFAVIITQEIPWPSSCVTPFTCINTFRLFFFLRIWVQNRFCKVYSHTSTLTQFTPLPCKQLRQHRHSPAWGAANSWLQGEDGHQKPYCFQPSPKTPSLIPLPNHVPRWPPFKQLLTAAMHPSSSSWTLAHGDALSGPGSPWAGTAHITLLHPKAGGQGRLRTLPWHQKNCRADKNVSELSTQRWHASKPR